MTPLIKIILKLMIAVGVTFFVGKPVLVTFVFQTAILFELIFDLSINPYTETQELVRQVFTGLTCLALSYNILLFTDFVDSEMFPTVASATIYIIYCNVGGDLMITIYPFVLKSVGQTKKFYLRWRRIDKIKRRALKKSLEQLPTLSNNSEQGVEAVVSANSDTNKIPKGRLESISEEPELSESSQESNNSYKQREVQHCIEPQSKANF